MLRCNGSTQLRAGALDGRRSRPDKFGSSYSRCQTCGVLMRVCVANSLVREANVRRVLRHSRAYIFGFLLGWSLFKALALCNSLPFAEGFAHLRAGALRTSRRRVLRHSHAYNTSVSLLSRTFFEIFTLYYSLSFADLLLHEGADFKRQAEQRDEALRVLVVVKVASRERRDVLVVKAVL